MIAVRGKQWNIQCVVVERGENPQMGGWGFCVRWERQWWI